MTPRGKAKELVEKYANTNGVYGASKRCALIAVDEMLKHMSFHFGQIGISTLEYWNQVKQEIQKL